MNNLITVRHLILSAMPLLLLLGNLTAQTQKNTYFFDGNEVVFVFDVRTYGQELKKQNPDKVDFSDLKIFEVAISGDFNNWSKQGWRMQKKSEFVFELRKLIEEFNDPFPLEFKYIINGKFITDPVNKDPNSRQFSDDFLEEVYKLDLSVIKITDSGNTLFILKGRKDAKEVILSGSFNGWDEHAIKMKPTTEGWALRAELPPGRYEYKFIVDGEWTHDPANDIKVTNEHGTFNSVLNVTVPVVFNLEGFPQADNVILTGSFVNWNEKKIKMTLVNGVWTTTLPLPGGKHYYKYIINGQWHTDPSNPIIEDDGYGNLNSVLFVH